MSTTPIMQFPDEKDSLRNAVSELNQRLIERTSVFMDSKARDVAMIRTLETRLAQLTEIAEGMAESIQRGGIVAAQECRLNATYHIRIMKEALAAYRAFREEGI